MKIYLSGPMTGLPDLNKPTFDFWEHQFTEQGHEVINPSKLEDLEWAESVARDIILIRDCDAIFLMDGWHNSYGSVIEALVGYRYGKFFLFEKAPVDGKVYLQFVFGLYSKEDLETGSWFERQMEDEP